MFGNWTFGTLVFTVMVITVTLKVNTAQLLVFLMCAWVTVNRMVVDMHTTDPD